MKGKNLQTIGLIIIIIAVTFPFFTSQQTLAISNVNALSGSASDIQVAVDQVVASGGIGDVHIPEGTFNFVEVGEPWMTVNIPAGVNIFGAPTQRDANDQVVEWKTVLVMPSEVGDGAIWFGVTGTGDPNKPSRFSDIKLVGYRSIDPNSTSMHTAISVKSVIDFRIDHSYFEHTTAGVSISSVYLGSPTFRGVIDHNKFVNIYGTPTPWGQNTIGYGVHVLLEWHENVWEPIEQVLGYYKNYTVFIEDNYFEKWRHSTTTNNGGHIVFRHNIIKNDFGYGSIDQHEKRTETAGRAYEIYENQFLDPIYGWGQRAINWRGGGGVAFNNIVTGYTDFVHIYEYGPYQEEIYQPHDIWVWNNSLPGDCTTIRVEGNIQEGVHYFLYAKPDYTPYQYPHPLVSGEPPAIDGMGTLNVEASYNNQSIIANVEVIGTTSTFNGQTPYSQELLVGTYTVVVTSDYGSNSRSIEILSDQATSINIKWSSTSETPIVDVKTESERSIYLSLMQIAMVFVGAFMIWKGRKK